MKKMNKLFSKVAALSVGLAMAIGVGAAVGSRSVMVVKAEEFYTETTFDNLATDDVVVIVGNNGSNYALGNNNGSASAPSAVAVTVVDTSLSGTIPNTILWKVTKSGTNIEFTVNGGTGKLTCGTANNGMRVDGTGGNSVFSIKDAYIYNSTNGRYVGIYNSQDWRCYTTINNNIKDQTFKFFKKASESHGTLVSLAVSGSMTKTEYTTAEAWDPSGLTVMGTYDTSDVVDVTSSVTWSYNPTAPAVSVTSVVATASIGEVSGSSAAQAVTVSVAHAGTAEDPFTVAEALKKCTEIGAVGNKGQGPWVTKGIITKVTSAPAATYWNATYYISDDGSETNELQVYRGFYLNNVQFNEETAQLLKVGKVATITGNLTGSYGSEYCQGNYLLALEDQETGDVDVVFEPSETSIEIGATGTYTATSNTAGAVFTWSSDNPDVLSVDETTGEFEALALGVAKITVTATANDKVGSTYANITVNGNSAMTVDEAVALAATIPSGQTTSYYVYVEGFVKEFATSLKDSDPAKPRALDIMSEDESAKIMVYTNVDPYADFVEGLNLGDRIVVKANVQNYNGTYELTSPEKISSAPSAITFAFELLEQTDGQCATYIDNESDYDEFKTFFEGKWSNLKTLYNSLSSGESGEKAKVASAERNESGTTLEQAVARYDFLTGKYQLDNFVEGRTPIVHVGAYSNMALEGNPTIFIVIAIATASTLAFTMLLVFKKKKQN